MESSTIFIFREERNKQEAERLARELEEHVSLFYLFSFYFFHG